jgi:adenine-specific DNA-methyltransferase
MPTLHWIGKDKVINHHQDVPFRLLDHQYGALADGTQTTEPTGSGNQIIHGDNLEALKALLPQYEGRVKCIYIDPPYNTGNEGWVYNDNVNDPKIKKWLSQVVGKEGEDLSRHDKWLCMMYPRLKLLHKLLAEDGSIWISIDDNELSNLRLLMDEIFGNGNFIANIIWQKRYSAANDAKNIAYMHDYVTVFRKSAAWQRNMFPRTEENDKQYKFKDETGRAYRLSDYTCNKTAEERPNLYYPVINPHTQEEVYPNRTRVWAYGKEEHQNNIDAGLVHWSTNKNARPSYKRFKDKLKGGDGTVPTSWWTHEFAGNTDAARKEIRSIFSDSKTIDDFPTPKPSTLIDRVLQVATNKDSIVLDSFAGSGTTAHAVLKLNQQDGGNRKFILTEMEDYAEHITAERVKRVMQGYAGLPGTGGSFDYLTLGEPVFTESGELNEQAGLPGLRQYLYYAETKQPLPTETADDNAAFLGQHDGAAYYFHYAPEEVTTLDHEFLSTIATKAGQYIVYADNCLLTAEFMTQHGLIFNKIPRDISRF